MIPDLVVVAGDTTWTTPAWPVIVPGVGAILGLAAVFAAALVPGRGGGKPLVAAGIGLATLFFTPLLAGTPALVWGPRGGEEAGPRAADLFGELVISDLLLAGVALLFVGAALAVWVARPRGKGAPWLAIGLAGPAVLAAGLGLGHAAWMRSVGALPGLGGALPPRIHVGREVSAEAALLGVDPAGWTLAPVTVRPTAPGPVAATIRATRPGISGERPLAATAGEDRFAPEVAIAVGDTWIYEETTTWRSHYLWFVSAPGRAVGPRTIVRVTGVRETPALRYHTVEVRSGEGTTTHEVYAWDGAALIDAPDPGTEPTPLLAYTPGEPADADGLVPCSSGVLPGGCSCVRTAPGGAVALPGPARCAWTTGGAMSSGVSLFLAVVTVGLVLEDPNRSRQLELVASGRDLPMDTEPANHP